MASPPTKETCQNCLPFTSIKTSKIRIKNIVPKNHIRVIQFTFILKKHQQSAPFINQTFYKIGIINYIKNSEDLQILFMIFGIFKLFDVIFLKLLNILKKKLLQNGKLLTKNTIIIIRKIVKSTPTKITCQKFHSFYVQVDYKFHKK